MERIFELIGIIIVSGGAISGLFWVITKKMGNTIIESGLKKYQQHLDKQKYKFEQQFSLSLSKESEAIHEIYSEFSILCSFIFREISGEENLFEDKNLSVWDKFAELKKLRNNFLDSYEPNRIFLTKELCKRIDESVLSVDEFIDNYRAGISFDTEEEFNEATADSEPGTNFFIGLWPSEKMNELRQKIVTVKSEIENEFRAKYNH